MSRLFILKFAAVACLLVAPVLSLADKADAAKVEGASPFYVWSSEITATPGHLLRQEPLEPRLLLENAATGTRVLYTSEGFSGETVAVSGAVFTPKGEVPKGGWPVLAWAHGTVGVADVCAPSHKGRGPRDVTYLNHWLAAGYAIVATDYEGLGTPGTHPYLHCRSEASGTIDGVIAAHQLDAPLSDSWMVTGQSQGGQAALCTGAYAEQRESELQFLGTLATAPGVNFMQRFRYGKAEDANPFIGIALLLGRGFETYEPSFKREEAFTEKALALMPYTDQTCVQELIGLGYQAALTSGESMKYIPFSDTPGVAAAAEKMEIPLQGWAQPVYIAQGTADELVRYQDVYDFGADLCKQGVTVTLNVLDGADHSGPMNQGVEEFMQWAAERFAGKPAADNCEEIDKLVEAEKSSQAQADGSAGQ
ncbi:MAG: lipase family protein [Pseudomonadales bacterium]